MSQPEKYTFAQQIERFFKLAVEMPPAPPISMLDMILLAITIAVIVWHVFGSKKKV